MHPSIQDIEEAALDLATSARELLGLPVERHVDASSSKPTIDYHPEVLPVPPSALEFSRRLAGSCAPLIIHNCLADRPALLQQWRDPRHLTTLLGNRKIRVAATPDGRADDLKQCTTAEGGQSPSVFGLPAEVEMTFEDFVKRLQQGQGPVYYLQSQDSNLTDPTAAAGDLSPLLRDLKGPRGNLDLTWASEAFGAFPEATNLWVGEQRSRSSMHRDHYENLFTVLTGKKIFTVFPPTEEFFLCEDGPYPCHRHASDPPHSLLPKPDPDTPPTPWIPIDPTQPPTSPRNAPHQRYAKGLKPLRIEVQPGETLYLPAGWWHFVEQQGTVESQRVTIAVNWWYESQAAFGPQWALLEFVKRLGEMAKQD